MGARIRLATNGERLICSWGRANPRQPGSSPRPTKRGMNRKRSGNSRNFATEGPDTGEPLLKRGTNPTATRQIRIGVANVSAYHFAPTRQRTIRPKNLRRPDRPEMIAVTMIPAISGPSGFGPLVRPRINAMIHGYQESANASKKNTTKLFRWTKAFTRPR